MEASRHPTPLPPAVVAAKGEIFTRRWVAELILDLAGFTSDQDLVVKHAVEPACGDGAFLRPMVQRIAASARLYGRDIREAMGAITALDLSATNVTRSQAAVTEELTGAGHPTVTATELATCWVQQRDYLLDPPPEQSADYVVGNPPYIRLEDVPRDTQTAYRISCPTMRGRADLYVGFYDRGLRTLRDGGTLAYICADRWMRNAYGAPLRELIGSEWAVETLLSLTDADVFQTEVDAYPAITVIRRAAQHAGPLVIEGHSTFAAEHAAEVVALAKGRPTAESKSTSYQAARLERWSNGRGGWPAGSPDKLAVIADIEARFAPLEDARTGTKVGIGVATGADKVFVVRDPDLVERERLLPLALPSDLGSGQMSWSGRYLVNPWDDTGLVELEEWPRLNSYLSENIEVLKKRHTAKRGAWHRTIDRVTAALVTQKKLYLPDFKEAIWPVLDDGFTYPHHNLYWVTSDKWDLRVLGGLLLSNVANLFIEAYSIRMRGGYLRFQAQYLRRIRVPAPETLTAEASADLAAAFDARDRRAATEAALPLYGLERLSS